MCAADTFQEKSGNLCLTVKFTLGNSYFLFRLETKMHVRYLYCAILHLWTVAVPFYSVPVIQTHLITFHCLNPVLFFTDLFYTRIVGFLGGSEMLESYLHNKQLYH